jgi:myo-inositol-1(or 4)-monophosphatase
MSFPPDPDSTLLPALRYLVREAGTLALASFRLNEPTSAQIWSKSGGSPVTSADLAVDAFLKKHVRALKPEAAWLSEESADDASRLNQRNVWIVDPIDGTRAFASGHADWSIVVALVRDGRPVLGIVYAPAHDTLYEAVFQHGAWCNGVRLNGPLTTSFRKARFAGPLPMAAPLETLYGPLIKVPRIPSLALRLVRLAEGSHDIGFVSSGAWDWDIAAADVILREAGARLTDQQGQAPLYNQAYAQHQALFATSKALHPLLMEAVRDLKPPAPYQQASF